MIFHVTISPYVLYDFASSKVVTGESIYVGCYRLNALIKLTNMMKTSAEISTISPNLKKES